MQRPAPFLPHPDHIGYLANLLTVLAILYGAWLVLKARTANKRNPKGTEPGYATWGPA